LGVAGLQGMGQRDLFLACFGMAEVSGGTLRVDGVDAVVLSPSQAIRAGICLVPEDRKTEGLFLELNGRHNASMPVIQRFIGGGLIDHAVSRIRGHALYCIGCRVDCTVNGVAHARCVDYVFGRIDHVIESHIHS
jgi:ABC-type sugar transport system ATPase subunit